MTQPHKTLEDCLEHTAQLHGYADWLQIDMTEDSECEKNEVKARLTMEAAKLFESQFVKKADIPNQIQELYKQLPDCGLKNHLSHWFELRYPSQHTRKDSVSSDVEQAAKEYAETIHPIVGLNENSVPYVTAFEYNGDVQEAFIAGYKYCQSTQQPATINWLTDEEIDNMFGKSFVTSSLIYGAKRLQSKLKERVNCVDPVEFAQFVVGLVKSAPVNMIVVDEKLIAVFIEYKNQKTTPNGQK